MLLTFLFSYWECSQGMACIHLLEDTTENHHLKLKVTYLHSWNFFTYLLFTGTVFLGQTWCYSLLVTRKTHKEKKKIIITSCRVIIPRTILLKTHDFFIRRRKIVMLITYWLIWVILMRFVRIIQFFFFQLLLQINRLRPLLHYLHKFHFLNVFGLKTVVALYVGFFIFTCRIFFRWNS